MKLKQSQFEKLKALDRALIDKDGREVLNPVPAKFPTTLDRPTSTMELIKRVVRDELSREAQAQGEETFLEADDFDVPDDFDVEILSQYEMTDMQEELLYKTKEQIAQEVEIENGKETRPADPVVPVPGESNKAGTGIPQGQGSE